jgi:hypothetical protein
MILIGAFGLFWFGKSAQLVRGGFFFFRNFSLSDFGVAFHSVSRPKE